MASPFIILGSGFLRAVFAVLETRGAPWIMRGSVIRLVSRCAGATGKVSVSGLAWSWSLRAYLLLELCRSRLKDSAGCGWLG